MSGTKISNKMELKSEAGLSTGAIIAIVLGSVALVGTVLVVLILGAVAGPAYVNQNQRANDAGVESDVRNVATAIEEALIADPNSESIEVHSSEGSATISVSGEAVQDVTLADGVTVETKEPGTTNGYILYGFHENGQMHKENEPLVYNSANGGF